MYSSVMADSVRLVVQRTLRRLIGLEEIYVIWLADRPFGDVKVSAKTASFKDDGATSDAAEHTNVLKGAADGAASVVTGASAQGSGFVEGASQQPSRVANVAVVQGKSCAIDSRRPGKRRERSGVERAANACRRWKATSRRR